MVNWFTRNWSLKLISFILAIGLWYYAVGEEGIQVTRLVPLQLEVKNPQMSILKTSARAVQVTFMAPRALVSELTSSDIEAVHIISNDINKAGDYSFRLEANEIKVKNPQIRILRIEPETLQVTLDELIVKKMEIKPDFIGDPAFGYKLKTEEIQLNPNAVLVEGPKAKLEQLEGSKSEKINLVGRTRSFRQTISLQLPPNVKLSGGESLIDLYVPILEESDEKKIEGILVKIVKNSGENQKVEMTPPKISFTIRGSKKQLEKIQPEAIFAYVDVSPFTRSGDYDAQVDFFLPDGVAIKGDPIKVKVSIKK